jgi:hypothetical protein
MNDSSANEQTNFRKTGKQCGLTKNHFIQIHPVFWQRTFLFSDLPDLSKNQSRDNRFHVIPYRQIHRPGQSVCPGKSTARILPAFSNALKPSLKNLSCCNGHFGGEVG